MDAKKFKEIKMKILNALLITMLLSFSAMAEEVLKNPFMWKIEKNNQTSYLFGTIHVPAKELSALPASVKKVIKSCDGVRTEIDMDSVKPMEIMHLMMRKDKRALDQILSKELYHRTDKILKDINPVLNLNSFAQMKIWALSSTLMLLEEQMKNLTLVPIDNVVFNYGKEQNKTLGGIETLKEQISYFDTFTLEEQVLFLESTLDYMEENKDAMKTLKQLYIQGDSQKLLDYTYSQFGEGKYKKIEEKFMEELLYKRNRLMVDRIEKLLKQDTSKSYFFAFGVLHFLDKKSVVSYLEKRGYKVHRMN